MSTQISEEKIRARELWYPAFGLESNPFRCYDFKSERGFVEDIPQIPTKAIDFITELAESKVSCGISGDRGIGKSTMLEMAYRRILTNKRIPLNAINCFLSPSSTFEIYNDLFEESLPREKHEGIEGRRGGYNEDLLEKILDVIFDMSWFGLGYVKGDRTEFRPDQVSHIYCKYPFCNRRPPRCEFPLSKTRESGTGVAPFFNGRYVIDILQIITDYCSLKLHLTEKIFLERRFRDNHFPSQLFLVDLPDDLARAEEFMGLIRLMKDLGTVILVGTREHQRRLKKFDLFARFPSYEFPLMTNEELKDLCRKRIEWQQREGFPFPFTKDALDHIVKKSLRNPRTMIQTCSSLLVDAKLEGITTPIELDFVKKSSFMPSLSLDDAVKRLVEKYCDMQKGWVSLEQSCQDMNEYFNISIEPRSLGRMLKKLMDKGGPPIAHRYNPKSEYRYTGNEN